MKLMKIVLLCICINNLDAMESNSIDARQAKRLEKSNQLLREIGDYYDFTPADNTPLDEETVMNPFWKKVKSLSTQEEKKKCIEEYHEKASTIERFTTWAHDRLYYAGHVYAEAPYNNPKRIPYSFTEALIHKDIPLLEVLIRNETVKKNIENLDTSEVYRFFNSPTATTCEGAMFLLNAGVVMPRTILHIAMHASHEPALVNFYRNKGACPLKTDKEELPREQWPTRDWLGMPLSYSPAALPLIDLAANAHSHKQFSDVFGKFDSLTHDLSDNQLIFMFEHNKEHHYDVMSILKKRDHPHEKALLRVIENRYAELKN